MSSEKWTPEPYNNKFNEQSDSWWVCDRADYGSANIAAKISTEDEEDQCDSLADALNLAHRKSVELLLPGIPDPAAWVAKAKAAEAERDEARRQLKDAIKAAELYRDYRTCTPRYGTGEADALLASAKSTKGAV